VRRSLISGRCDIELKQTDIPLDFNEADKQPAGRVHREPASALECLLLRKLLRYIGRPAVSVCLWDGQRIESDSGRRAVGTITVTDRSVLRDLLMRGELAFGDRYSDGGLLIDGSLYDVLAELMSRSDRQRRRSRISGFVERARSRPRRNSLQGSAQNIHHHYDIGNDFYRLWLDTEMQYTCAYYPEPDLTIEEAQTAKMHHICRKLELQPGDRVIEAGCGWGGLARFMAREYGATVVAYNISAEQIAWARQQALNENIDDRVSYVQEDYRNISGQCDKFVSVGMLEHVGLDNFHGLGAVIDRCLASNGRGLIHSIGRDTPRPVSAWIQARIFPGGYVPTLAQMAGIFERNNFSILDCENLRLHYAKTLDAWHARFESHASEIREQFDERFIRMWRLYLVGSIAAFRTSSLQLFQVSFARSDDNSVAMTRPQQATLPSSLVDSR